MTHEATITPVFGHVRLVQTQEVRGSRIYMGGYAIHYDQHGCEVSRTENTWNCYVECGDSAEAARLSRQARESEHGT